MKAANDTPIRQTRKYNAMPIRQSKKYRVKQIASYALSIPTFVELGGKSHEVKERREVEFKGQPQG